MLLLVSFIMFFSCEERIERVSGIESQESLAPVTAPDIDQAIVTFVSGSASLVHAGSWQPLDVGDLPGVDDTLAVDPDSYCEVQIGEKAVLRIEENTTVVMKELFLKEGETDVDVEVALGSVLFKVKKLAEKESFTVNTPSSACGVRGTTFMVRELEEEGTIIAVKEGRVAVLPAGAATRELRKQLGDDQGGLAGLLDSIEEEAPVIEGGNEILVSRKVEPAVAEEFDEFKTAFEKAAKAGAADDTLIAALKQNGKKLMKSVVRTIDSPSELAKENVVLFEKVEKAEIHDLGEAENGDDVLGAVRVAVKAVPAQAAISLNGEPAGKGSVSGLFTPGEEVTIGVSLTGYIEKKVTIVPKSGMDARYTIKLDKEKEDESAVAGDAMVTEESEEAVSDTAKEEAMVPEEPDVEITLKTVSLIVTPDDAEILLDGKTVGKGTYTAEFASGEEIEFVVRKNGYKTAHYPISIDENTKKNHTVSLKARGVENTITASFAAVAGNPVLYRDRIIVADAYGVLTAATMGGEKAWTISTNNQSNTNSAPVLIGSRVCFSGSGEFVIADAETGAVVKSRALDNASSHIFGRRVVPFGKSAVYPENGKLVVFDPETGTTIREIAVPGESRMTPAVYNGTFLIADTKGTFLMIDAASGNMEAEVPTGLTTPVALAPTVHGTSAYVAGRKGMVACIDLKKKEVAWETLLSGDKQAAVYNDMLFGNNTLFAFSRGTVYALDAATGAFLYDGIRNLSAPPAYLGGSLVFGTRDKKLVVADAKTGKVKTSLAAGEEISARPVLEKGKIMAGTASGKVLIIDSEDML